MIGKTYDFAKWRFSKYKIKIDNSYNINESIVYEDILKNVEHYDCIFSFEVFNMLMDPEEEVKYLTRFIKIRGYLIYTAKFNNAYKLVLPRDNNYSNYFKKTLNNFNLFEVGTIPLWGEGVDKRYLHIFQKK